MVTSMGWVERLAPAIWLVMAVSTGGCRQSPDDGATTSAARKQAGVTTAASNPHGKGAAPRPPWPTLPGDLTDLDALISKRSQRPTQPHQELTAKGVIATLRHSVEHGTAIMGWPAIVAALELRLSRVGQEGRSGYLLFGHHHDAPAQVEAFRRITGPLGIEPAPLGAIEQLQANGRWTGLPQADQLGDEPELADYLRRGNSAALTNLRDAQRQRNYTAWKYGYVPEVLDLLLAARAGQRPLMGCDMPTQLQSLARATLGPRSGELRDLHCALALRDRLAGMAPPHRVALFWGSAHLNPARLPRFLPAAAEVWSIELLGGRLGSAGVEVELGRHLKLADPALLPLPDNRFLLLLPEQQLRAAVDPVRRRLDGALETKLRHRLTVYGLTGGSVRVGPKKLAQPPEGAMIKLTPGSTSFLIDHDDALLAGGLTMPNGGQLELHLEVDGTLRVVARVPATAAQ
jgi:hypothetical protein